MKITANKYVAVTYDLNVGEGEERELMEKATVEAPLKFIYGTGMMLPYWIFRRISSRWTVNSTPR